MDVNESAAENNSKSMNAVQDQEQIQDQTKDGDNHKVKEPESRKGGGAGDNDMGTDKEGQESIRAEGKDKILAQAQNAAANEAQESNQSHVKTIPKPQNGVPAWPPARPSRPPPLFF